MLKRGQMLVADDRVEVRHKPGGILVGSGHQMVQHHMEVRGLGIIDVWKIFGVGAVLKRSLIELVVYLEMWDPKKEYDRMGLEENHDAPGRRGARDSGARPTGPQPGLLD
ncbi:MAG: hypothetical protein IPQ26_07505 [Elusimicrobia bacterium]|nr:hypothetical protein [Elusimicrobiota bacterium]